MRHAGAGQGNKVLDEPQQMSIAEFTCIIAIRTGAVATGLRVRPDILCCTHVPYKST
jgi:hypothetical protein